MNEFDNLDSNCCNDTSKSGILEFCSGKNLIWIIVLIGIFLFFMLGNSKNTCNDCNI
ncbi:MAG: hypothetical protein RR594_03230 [Clostridia bacterium]